MVAESFLIRKWVVLGFALIYWIGVLIQVYRVRKRIGRSPNVKPRGLKETLLWGGWLFVIGGWIGQPLLVGSDPPLPFFSLFSFFIQPFVMFLGILMMVSGYGGTLWCYATLGDAWRMGIRKREKTILVKSGPYRFVRHPIYLFQTLMLAGTLLLLPTPFSLILFVVHLLCVYLKAFDEETYLLIVHGSDYRDYLSRTGRLLPKMRRFMAP